MRPAGSRRGRLRRGRRLHRQRRRDHADPRGGRHPVVRTAGHLRRPSCPARTATRSPPACSAWPGSAHWPPRTAARRVASVNYDLPDDRPDQPAGRPRPGQRGRRPVDADQGAADDHGLQRHRPGGQRLRLRRGRYPPQALLGIAAAGVSLGSETTYYVVPGGLTDRRPPTRRARRSRARSRCPASRPRTTRSGTTPRRRSVTWRTSENGGWSAMFLQNTWVGYRTFLSLIKNNDDLSAAGVKATLDETTAVDTDGFTPPFSFAEEFPAPGLNRVFNHTGAHHPGQGRQAGPGRRRVHRPGRRAGPRVLGATHGASTPRPSHRLGPARSSWRRAG